MTDILKEIPKPDEVLDLFSQTRIKALYEDINNNLVEQILQGRVEVVIVINNTNIRDEAEIRKSDVHFVMKKIKRVFKKKGWKFNYSLLVSSDDRERVINVRTTWSPLIKDNILIKNAPIYTIMIGIVVFVTIVITAAIKSS